MEQGGRAGRRRRLAIGRRAELCQIDLRQPDQLNTAKSAREGGRCPCRLLAHIRRRHRPFHEHARQPRFRQDERSRQRDRRGRHARTGRRDQCGRGARRGAAARRALRSAHGLARRRARPAPTAMCASTTTTARRRAPAATACAASPSCCSRKPASARLTFETEAGLLDLLEGRPAAGFDRRHGHAALCLARDPACRGNRGYPRARPADRTGRPSRSCARPRP